MTSQYPGHWHSNWKLKKIWIKLDIISYSVSCNLSANSVGTGNDRSWPAQNGTGSVPTGITRNEFFKISVIQFKKSHSKSFLSIQMEFCINFLKCFECGFLTLYDTNLEKIISGYLLSVATGPVPSGAGRCRSGLVPVSTEFAKSSQEML